MTTESKTPMRAEIRQTTGYSGEAESYLVLISEGKSWPYLHIPEELPDRVLEQALEKLNAPDEPAQAIKERDEAYERAAQIADKLEIDLCNRLLSAAGITERVDGLASEIALAIRALKENKP